MKLSINLIKLASLTYNGGRKPCAFTCQLVQLWFHVFQLLMAIFGLRRAPLLSVVVYTILLTFLYLALLWAHISPKPHQIKGSLLSVLPLFIAHHSSLVIHPQAAPSPSTKQRNCCHTEVRRVHHRLQRHEVAVSEKPIMPQRKERDNSSAEVVMPVTLAMEAYWKHPSLYQPPLFAAPEFQAWLPPPLSPPVPVSQSPTPTLFSPLLKLLPPPPP